MEQWLGGMKQAGSVHGSAHCWWSTWFLPWQEVMSFSLGWLLLRQALAAQDLQVCKVLVEFDYQA